MADQGSGVVVFVAQGEPEADQVRAFLAANGINTFVSGEALRKTHGFTLNGLGEVRIIVADSDAEQARDLIARVNQGELSLAEDQEVE